MLNRATRTQNSTTIENNTPTRLSVYFSLFKDFERVYIQFISFFHLVVSTGDSLIRPTHEPAEQTDGVSQSDAEETSSVCESCGHNFKSLRKSCVQQWRRVLRVHICERSKSLVTRERRRPTGPAWHHFWLFTLIYIRADGCVRAIKSVCTR